MRMKANNFQESVMPLTFLFAIIGQGFYYYPGGRLRPVFSIIYSIVLTTTAITAAVMVVQMSYASSWFGKEEKIFYNVIYVSYGLLMLIQGFNWYHARVCTSIIIHNINWELWLTSVNLKSDETGSKDYFMPQRVKTFQTLRTRISDVDETLKQLGVTFDYSRDMRVGFFVIGVWILVIICLDSIDMLWLFNVAPIRDILKICVILHYPVHVNAVIAAIFCADVRYWILYNLFEFSSYYVMDASRLICLRFKKLNLLLESLNKPDQQPANIKKFQILRRKINPTPAFTISSNRIIQPSQYVWKRKDIIQIIKWVSI